MRHIIAVLLLLLVPASAWAWPARVVRVTDGDTITVEPDAGGDPVNIRLHGIDAPESRQPGGPAATEFVVKTILYRVVDVQVAQQKNDGYGRTVAIVYLPDGESLQAALLRSGLAWVWPQYCKNCSAWQQLQDDARVAKHGLWVFPDSIPPWKWRKSWKYDREMRVKQ